MDLLVLVPLSLVFVAGGFLLGLSYATTRRFLTRGRAATGVVLDVKVSADDQENYPVVRFETAEGREVVFTSREDYYAQVGQTVGMFYNPANPQDARLGSRSSMRRGALSTLAMGVVLALIGVSTIFFTVWSWPPGKD